MGALTHDEIEVLHITKQTWGEEHRLVGFVTDDGEVFIEQQARHGPTFDWRVAASPEGAEMQLSGEEAEELLDFLERNKGKFRVHRNGGANRTRARALED